MNAFEAARRIVVDAIAAGVFPAATVEVGASAGVIWCDALGTLTFVDGAAPTRLDTPFDLASLTKVIATTTAVMDLVGRGAVRLEDRIAALVDEWRGADRENVTVRDLLEHASGLPARLLDPPDDVRRAFEHDICTMPLEYEPRTRSIYSDLGFILLGSVIADRGGASLNEQFDRLEFRLEPDTTDDVDDTQAGLSENGHVSGRPASSSCCVQLRSDLTFDLPANRRSLAAPTLPMDADVRRGRLLAGEVHDNYAAALGGVAGHAGLFGTAAAVGLFARAVLRAARGEATAPPPFSPALASLFTTKTTVPGSSRALGWDTMLPTSSCGTRMSPSAFGHVGFTGTSLWIDPQRDRYFVLLTNRACGGGTPGRMRDVRRAFHDALGAS
jgi:serine-type D-Ala-D-Ala carboxypeptidase